MKKQEIVGLILAFAMLARHGDGDSFLPHGSGLPDHPLVRETEEIAEEIAGTE